MQCQYRKIKSRSSFFGRLTHAAVLMTILPIALSACTTVHMHSMEDVKELAGTWQGTGYVTDNSFLFATLVIGEDGSYELTGSVTSKGVVKIERNHIKIGPFNLWVYDQGKTQILRGHGDAAQLAFSRRR